MIKVVMNEHIGETRAAVFEGKRCVELHLARKSEERRAFPGDIYSGRIRAVDTSLSAAFVDLGHGPEGFLNFSLAAGAPKFREGIMVRVKVSREQEAEKGPILSYIERSEAEAPKREKGGNLKQRLMFRYPSADYVDTGDIPDFEAALERDVALKGGGSISIEPTKAVCAIDVDTGIGGNKKTVSLAAAREIARQVRLRGIGGLILIDFPNIRGKKDKDDIYQCLVDNFANDPNPVKIAPMSRFCTIEISRAKPLRSIMDMMLDRHGLETPETVALTAITRLIREGRSRGGAKLSLIAPKPAYDWLNHNKSIWEKPLTETLGARFEIVKGDHLDIMSDR